MAPEDQSLVDMLNQLRQQLATARQLDPEVTARLRQTLADIQEALGQSAASTAGDTEGDVDDAATLTNRLHEAARHFEESHPTISLTLGRLIDGLGQMGI